MHAAIDYCMKWYPQDWWQISNRVVVLTVPDEKTLFDIYQECLRKGSKTALFCEPDKDYEATALALEPSDQMFVDLHKYPLLGRKVSPHVSDKARRELCRHLETSHQNDKQTLMDHGLSIREASFNLLDKIYGNHAKGQDHWSDSVVPESMLEGPFNEFLRSHLHDAKTIWNYTLFHDCGKPDCLELDAEGRRHFLKHEEFSSDVWSKIGTEDEARLMLLDMTFHRMKSEGFEDFVSKASKSDVATLLLTAYAETYANAVDNSVEGVESVSFKIKKKNLDRLTKKLVLWYR